MQLLKEMQVRIKRGISALDPNAAAELFSAVKSLQCPDGGFCGLDGKPDLYYSYFAVFMLEACGFEYDADLLLKWVRSEFPESHGVDRICAQLLLLRAKELSRGAARFSLLKSLLQIGPADSYKIFLTSLLMEELLPAVLCRFLIRRAAASTLRKRRVSDDFNALSTPVAAVCLLLASESGDAAAKERMQILLSQRHRSSGGYCSAPGAHADLLSTAVVLFVNVFCGNAVAVDKNDSAFIELCWQDDRLFSSAPDQTQGDLEHTFYGLLALGCLGEV